MKDCCLTCDFCRFDERKLYPVWCKKHRIAYKEEYAFEHVCKDWKHGNLKYDDNLTKDIGKLITDGGIKNGHV